MAMHPLAPYGKATKYADPGFQPDKKKRYPVNSEAHVRAALAYINTGKDAEKYNPADYKTVKANIIAAAKTYGITVAESKSTKPAESKSSDADTVSRDESKSGKKVVPMAKKTLEELRARLEEIAERLTELNDGSEDRSLDDDEERQWSELETESAAIDTEIEKIEARAETLRTLASKKGGRETGSTTGSPAFHRERTEEDIFDVVRMRRDSSTDEDYAERLRDNAKRAVERAQFPIAKEGAYRQSQETSQTAVDDLLREHDNERGDIARRLMLTGSPAYERAWSKILKDKSTMMLSREEFEAVQRAQSVSTNSAGGFAVPFQLDPTVMLTNASTINPIRAVSRVEKIIGKEWEGVTSAGATVTRGSEAAVAPDSSVTLAQPTLTTNRVQAFVPFSYEIDLEWKALRNQITAWIMDAKDREEDSFFTGDGTGTNPFGVVTTGTNTFSTGASGTFVAGDVYTHETNLAPRWRPRGKWIANKAIYNKIRQFDSAGGTNLWQRIGAGLPPELLGYHAYEASALDSAVTASNPIMLFGDFSNFLILDRIGMNMELIPQVFDPTTARPTGQRGVYAMWMNNAAIVVQNAIAQLVVHA